MSNDIAKVCGQCVHYIGCGDWDICCKRRVRRLTYEHDVACDEFEQTDACRNITSYVGMFRCSICNRFCQADEVGDVCPGCGNRVTGRL